MPTKGGGALGGAKTTSATPEEVAKKAARAKRFAKAE